MHYIRTEHRCLVFVLDAHYLATIDAFIYFMSHADQCQHSIYSIPIGWL